MPEGMLQWYDDRRHEGRVVRSGRVYPVRSEDIVTRARIPGARVHFDIERTDGVERAVDVRLRPGRRTSRGRRRLGDLAGSRRPDAAGSAPFARPHPELGTGMAEHPEVVARRWAQLLGAGDVDSAVLLYAPDAVLHRGETVTRGRGLHAAIAASGLAGHLGAVDVAGAGAAVVVRWDGDEDGPTRTATSWMRIEHAQIVEQWLDGALPPHEVVREATGTPPDAVVEATADGAVPADAKAYAIDKIGRLTALTAQPILFARITLSLAPDPAVPRPAVAKATLDLNGRPVRAHVAGHTMTEAIDLLEARLRDRLGHRAEREKALRRLAPSSAGGEWRHGDLATTRPAWFDRPPEERELVRRKTFVLDELTVDEAAFDLDMLDYDFYLFRELATGTDAVLERDEGQYRVRRLQPPSVGDVPAAVAVRVVAEPAPVLSVAAAIERLDVGHERFVFFADDGTGRGRVVYRRYDGHYGLISPADELDGAVDPAGARRRLLEELDRLQLVRDGVLGEAMDDEAQGGSSELSSIDQHPADVASETFERERALSLLEDLDREIADVRRALAAVTAGSYGRCEACGRRIPDERLAAIPAARFCLEHQAADEMAGGLVD